MGGKPFALSGTPDADSAVMLSAVFCPVVI